MNNVRVLAPRLGPTGQQFGAGPQAVSRNSAPSIRQISGRQPGVVSNGSVGAEKASQDVQDKRISRRRAAEDVIRLTQDGHDVRQEIVDKVGKGTVSVDVVRHAECSAVQLIKRVDRVAIE